MLTLMDVHERGIYGNNTEVTAKLVFSTLYTILRAACGYFIPQSAMVLWWAVGIGSLFRGQLYLQYLWSTHFMVDIPVANVAGRVWKHAASSLCPLVGPCYDVEGQDVASFFAVVLTHAVVTRRAPGVFNSIVCGIAFVVYVVALYTAGHCHPLLTSASLLVGAVLGAARVLFFVDVIFPLFSLLRSAYS